MEPQEFRPYGLREGPFDRFLSLAPYFGAGLAITVILLGAIGFPLLLLLMAVGARSLLDAISGLSEGVFVTAFLAITLLGAFGFVRLRIWRLSARRLVIDDEGVTYCTASGGCRSLPWETIESVNETYVEGEDVGTYTLTIRGADRRIRFEDADLAGYESIRTLLRNRIPDRVTLRTPPD